jgi:hypothetical protein
MKSVKEYCRQLFTDPGTENERGNMVLRAFLPSERYRIDFADDFTTEGWEQFDTDQDAPYFGVWVNRHTLETLTYAEGDWTLCKCPDREHYNAEVSSCIQFYGEGYIAKSLDSTGQWTVYVQERSKFLIETPA